MFNYIYGFFLNILTFFIWLVPGHSAAWGIIFLTLLIRFILILPSKRAAQAQRKQAQLQPLLEELKKEYAGDRQGLAMAQMELYKKNGINPLGSCLPMLIQIPLLYILYRTILLGWSPSNPHLYTWLPKPAYINSVFLGLNLLKHDRTFIVPILDGALQYIQMRMILPPKPKGSTPSTDPSAAIQQQMAYLMPAFIFFAAFRLPSGVGLYWLVNSGFSIVQQHFVNKEKLRVSGLEKVVKEAELRHPEDTARLEGLKHQVEERLGSDEPSSKEEVKKELSESKKGVTVTVRKKKRA